MNKSCKNCEQAVNKSWRSQEWVREKIWTRNKQLVNKPLLSSEQAMNKYEQVLNKSGTYCGKDVRIKSLISGKQAVN